MFVFFQNTKMTDKCNLCSVLWLIWAFTPEWILHGISVTYYPDRYAPSHRMLAFSHANMLQTRHWAVALPIFLISLFVYVIIFYNAWNMVNTYPFESIYTVRGEKSQLPISVPFLHLSPPKVTPGLGCRHN